MSGWSNGRSAAGDRNPWLIVGVISLATFMEVLDTSIANVSLDHIAGGLAASRDEATWVLTSYLVSNAIVIPISGWLSDVIGRKRYYMISVALFTLSSLMCGFAPNLPFLIFARILQGIGGGRKSRGFGRGYRCGRFRGGLRCRRRFGGRGNGRRGRGGRWGRTWMRYGRRSGLRWFLVAGLNHLLICSRRRVLCKLLW